MIQDLDFIVRIRQHDSGTSKFVPKNEQYLTIRQSMVLWTCKRVLEKVKPLRRVVSRPHRRTAASPHQQKRPMFATYHASPHDIPSRARHYSTRYYLSNPYRVDYSYLQLLLRLLAQYSIHFRQDSRATTTNMVGAFGIVASLQRSCCSGPVLL